MPDLDDLIRTVAELAERTAKEFDEEYGRESSARSELPQPLLKFQNRPRQESLLGTPSEA